MPSPAALTEQPKSDPPAKADAAVKATPDKAAPAASDAVQSESQTKSDAASSEKPVRPAWLGKTFDSFWSDDKGVDAEGLEKEFGSLRSIQAEVEARAKEVPKDLAEYEVGLPEKFEIPKGLTFDSLADNPVVEDARAFAQKHGLNKDAFKELVGLYAKDQVTNYTALQTAALKQKELLGANANARVEAVVKGLPAALATVVPDQAKAQELANTLLPMMFTAKQIEAFEGLIKAATKNAGPKLSATGREVAQPEEISDEAYQNMSLTQRIVRATKIAAQRKT